MLGEGKSASQVAKALKVSRNTVLGKAHRLGLVWVASRKKRPQRSRAYPVEGAGFASPSPPRRFSWERPA